jgi:hypothetical protein
MPRSTRTPTLDPLEALVGDWTVDGALPSDPTFSVRGWVSFEWLAGGFFLVQRWGIEVPEFPDGMAIIGEDPSTGGLAQHYFDSRGIQRVYATSLDDGVWKLWRDDDDFSQRFTGAFSEDGATITGSWEIAHDGATWEHDFDLVYARVR